MAPGRRPLSPRYRATSIRSVVRDDGSGVYFFSNRDGGFGKDDIYFAPFDASTGRYGAAVNLGAVINSAGDEWAPVLSPDGQRLMFASDGHGGRGKHDLFVAHRAGTPHREPGRFEHAG